MEPIDRFTGPASAARLVEALRNQFIVHGNEAIANALAAVAKVTQHPPGFRLIEQEGADTDLFLILMGEVSILINGQEIARRGACQHVGEMALLDASEPRMASVLVRETVVVAAVSEADFSAIALREPELWRRIAVGLGVRLRERSRFIRPKNETPILFLGSSRESLPIVEAMVQNLKPAPFIVRPWTGGVFSASEFAIDDLERQLYSCDFAALVLGPDDEVSSRGITSGAPRDNVILELGLFLGEIKRPRTYLVIPRGVDIKIPTDLLGLNPLHFDASLADLNVALAGVCSELSALVAKHGAR